MEEQEDLNKSYRSIGLESFSEQKSKLYKTFCDDLFNKSLSIFLILVSSFLNVIILIFKGETNFKSALYSNLGGI